MPQRCIQVEIYKYSCLWAVILDFTGENSFACPNYKIAIARIWQWLSIFNAFLLVSIDWHCSFSRYGIYFYPVSYPTYLWNDIPATREVSSAILLHLYATQYFFPLFFRTLSSVFFSDILFVFCKIHQINQDTTKIKYKFKIPTWRTSFTQKNLH